MLTSCQGAPGFWTNRSCPITPFTMNLTFVSNHAALPVSQVNKGRVLRLGRGLRAKSKLQSPLSKINSLRIFQANINGLSTYAMKVKLDQFLELANTHNAQIIAIQKIKLKEQMKLNIKEFHINRPNRRGDGLALLIRDVKYQNTIIPQTSTDLETQGVSIFWEALDIALASADVFPFCHWSVLGSIGNHHLSVKIELKKPRKGILTREMFWNFGKADWPAFAELTEKDFSSLPLSHQLNVNWLNFKAVVIRNAKKTIPGGNFKSFKATYMHNDPCLRALVDKRDRLFQNLKT
ncbi:uncharacterized protein TNCV_3077051 [Trichonephila clavipes]|nr:uncharacterized protein TNCV_3077051 [Trichonephila clavipes]